MGNAIFTGRKDFLNSILDNFLNFNVRKLPSLVTANETQDAADINTVSLNSSILVGSSACVTPSPKPSLPYSPLPMLYTSPIRQKMSYSTLNNNAIFFSWNSNLLLNVVELGSL